MTDPDGPSAEMSAGSLDGPYDRLPPALKAVVQLDLLPGCPGIAIEAPDKDDDEADETRAARGILVGLILSVPCLRLVGAVIWWLVA
jgi:hypothetical protein